jgi:uncharacterized protein YlxW (UPF0749 family)
MAVHLLPLLKAMPGIIGAASGIIQSLTATKSAKGQTDERSQRLEDHVLQTARALEELASKVQTLALSLDSQTTALRAQTKRLKQALAVAWIAAGLASAALTVALSR